MPGLGIEPIAWAWGHRCCQCSSTCVFLLFISHVFKIFSVLSNKFKHFHNMFVKSLSLPINLQLWDDLWQPGTLVYDLEKPKPAWDDLE